MNDPRIQQAWKALQASGGLQAFAGSGAQLQARHGSVTLQGEVTAVEVTDRYVRFDLKWLLRREGRRGSWKLQNQAGGGGIPLFLFYFKVNRGDPNDQMMSVPQHIGGRRIFFQGSRGLVTLLPAGDRDLIDPPTPRR